MWGRMGGIRQCDEAFYAHQQQHKFFLSLPNISSDINFNFQQIDVVLVIAMNLINVCKKKLPSPSHLADVDETAAELLW